MFLEQVYVHSKIEGKVHRFPIYALLPHMYNLTHYRYPPPESTFVTVMNLCKHITESHNLRYSSLSVLYILWVWMASSFHSLALSSNVISLN